MVNTTKPASSARQPRLEITPEFSRVLTAVHTTDTSLFITGKAGTGKSTLLRYLTQQTEKRYVVLAPTGVAALNVEGQTIHSFFRLPARLLQRTDITYNARLAKRMRALDLLIIDEVSMVRADVLEAIDVTLRMYRQLDKPFGGVQMLFIGDLYQLPPVVPNDQRLYFQEHYGGAYFFDAPIFRAGLPLTCIELSRIFRQREPAFLALLNNIRNDEATADDLRLLNSRQLAVTGPAPAEAVILTATNAIAKRINIQGLDALPDTAVTYQATLAGRLQERYNDIMQRGGTPEQLERALDTRFPAEIHLTLKLGARVMMIRNDFEEERWVNGTLGVVQQVAEDRVLVTIDGKQHTVQPVTWEDIEYEYDEREKTIKPIVRGTFTQYPIRLAWAITIHKAQGKTLEQMVIDFGHGAFAPGQVYVALSRCRSLQGIYLTSPVRQRDIFVDPRIVEFMARMKG
jgi:ATP-dependent exoDNAse (exonuclease V) alpha subunit